MPTLVLDPPPAQLQELLLRRRRIGADHHDEMWDGVCHMTPAPSAAHALVTHDLAILLDAAARPAGLRVSAEFNLGAEDDYRVPDLGVHRESPRGAWIATAALVVEIVSPGDETWQKLPFYAAHGVEEVLIVDPATRKVDWLALDGGSYRPVEHSGVIDLGPAELTARIDWPPSA